MSGETAEMLELIRKFARNRVAAEEFAATYLRKWKQLRDLDELGSGDPYVRRALNVVFEAIDSVEDPASGRSIQTHSDELRIRVATVLSVIDGV